MRIKIMNGLLATATLVLLGACSTPMPCDPTGGLCAPIEANTRVLPPGSRAADLGAPGRAATAPAVPSATVETMPVEIPGAAPAAGEPVRIALLLPTRSEALGAPAQALRAGFMAAYERDKTGFIVTVIDTGDSTDETLNAYMDAKKSNDIIVGPLSRSAVGVIAASGTVSKPTIALNHPDGRSADNPIPPNMLVIGLSIEDEARQVAQWAAAEHPGTSAMIISGASSWQRRIASAFAAQWKQLGNTSQLAELTGSNGYLNEAAINQLKLRLETEPQALLFAALDASQLRQVRGILGSEMPVYGTSSINPGQDAGNMLAELDGMHLLDMPWQVQPDHPAAMGYPRWNGNKRMLDLDRLYALGIDAFRVAREVALKPGTPFRMDGVTGRLSVDFAKGRFERVQTGAVYQGGHFQLIDKR